MDDKSWFVLTEETVAHIACAHKLAVKQPFLPGLEWQYTAEDNKATTRGHHKTSSPQA